MVETIDLTAYIYKYKLKSYHLFTELKDLEMDYQSLIDITTDFEDETIKDIKGIEISLGSQRKEITRIIRENTGMERKIKSYQEFVQNRGEESQIDNSIIPEASSTPIKAKKSSQTNLKKLRKDFNQLKLDIETAKKVYKHGLPISELDLPEKLRATFKSSVELLANSVSGSERNQMIKLVNLLNVSKNYFILEFK